MITVLAIVAAVGWLTCAYGWHRAANTPAAAPYVDRDLTNWRPRCRCATEPMGRTTSHDGGRW